MSSDTVWHIIGLVASVTAAVWVLRSKLATQDSKLAAHEASDSVTHKNLVEDIAEIKRWMRNR